jgi:hypothetical protein
LWPNGDKLLEDQSAALSLKGEINTWLSQIPPPPAKTTLSIYSLFSDNASILRDSLKKLDKIISNIQSQLEKLQQREPNVVNMHFDQTVRDNHDAATQALGFNNI